MTNILKHFFKKFNFPSLSSSKKETSLKEFRKTDLETPMKARDINTFHNFIFSVNF